MNYHIEDLDTQKYHLIHLAIEDLEVGKFWPEREPIENEESTDIEVKVYWNIKQSVAAEFRKSKQKIADYVYLTSYEKYTVLYSRMTGIVYHFNNHKFALERVGSEEFWLRKITTGERQCIYRNGVFYSTKGDWLVTSSGELSKNKCSGIQMHSDLYGEIKIKNHQIVSAMFIGQKAIDLTMGDYTDHDINHRNLDNTDNRLENLEIVTKCKNNRHRRLLGKFMDEKLAEVLRKKGITNYTIIKKTK